MPSGKLDTSQSLDERWILADSIKFRSDVRPADIQEISQIVSATGFFRGDEIAVAIELVQERLQKGVKSGYEFILAELASGLAGFACYGLIPCTLTSFDLYWIVVTPAYQRRGLGQALIDRAEVQIRQAHGRHVYIETSGRPQYEPTRNFYMRGGYQIAATLPDFYALGDDKIIWRKILP